MRPPGRPELNPPCPSVNPPTRSPETTGSSDDPPTVQNAPLPERDESHRRSGMIGWLWPNVVGTFCLLATALALASGPGNFCKDGRSRWTDRNVRGLGVAWCTVL